MSLKDDATHCVGPWRCNPRGMAALHCYALLLTFIPVGSNNNVRKLFAVVILGVWTIAFLGDSFGYATVSTHQMAALTMFVGLLLGKLWDIETRRIASVWGISFDPAHEDDDE